MLHDNLRPTMRNAYWIHVIKADSGPDAYTIALSGAPERGNFDGPLPTVNYATWQRLSEALSNVGVPESVLKQTKADLDSQGFHTVGGVVLSVGQIASLGFNLAKTSSDESA